MIEIDCIDQKTGEIVNHPEELVSKNGDKHPNYTTIHFYPVGQCLMMAKLAEYAVQSFIDPEKIFSKEKDFVIKHTFARLYEGHLDQFGKELSQILKDLRPL